MSQACAVYSPVNWGFERNRDFQQQSIGIALTEDNSFPMRKQFWLTVSEHHATEKSGEKRRGVLC
jgi:hypothetical protein